MTSPWHASAADLRSGPNRISGMGLEGGWPVVHAVLGSKGPSRVADRNSCSQPRYLERTRLLHVDDGTNNELPSLGKVGRRAALLEVVNVDSKKSSEFRVTENAGPIGDGHKASVGLRSAAPRSHRRQGVRRVQEQGDTLGPAWSPILSATGHGSVADLKRVPWQQSVGISNSIRLSRGILQERHGP